jgi:hypothetical protein
VSLIEETGVLEKVRLLHEFATRRVGSWFAQVNRAIFGR